LTFCTVKILVILAYRMYTELSHSNVKIAIPVCTVAARPVCAAPSRRVFAGLSPPCDFLYDWFNPACTILFTAIPAIGARLVYAAPSQSGLHRQRQLTMHGLTVARSHSLPPVPGGAVGLVCISRYLALVIIGYRISAIGNTVSRSRLISPRSPRRTYTYVVHTAGVMSLTLYAPVLAVPSGLLVRFHLVTSARGAVVRADSSTAHLHRSGGR
jgi:hypothetical protein